MGKYRWEIESPEEEKWKGFLVSGREKNKELQTAASFLFITSSWLGWFKDLGEKKLVDGSFSFVLC